MVIVGWFRHSGGFDELVECLLLVQFECLVKTSSSRQLSRLLFHGITMSVFLTLTVNVAQVGDAPGGQVLGTGKGLAMFKSSVG